MADLPSAGKNPTVGLIGIAFGSVALLLATLQLFVGPFESQPAIEEVVADKVVAIRDATVARLKGETYVPAPQQSGPSIDRMVRGGAATAAALAIILGVISLVRQEPRTAAAGAGILGAGALAMQFAGLALGVIVLMLLIGPILSALDFSVLD